MQSKALLQEVNIYYVCSTSMPVTVIFVSWLLNVLYAESKL